MKGHLGSRILRLFRILLATGNHFPFPLVSPPFDQTGLEFNTVDLMGQLHTSV